MYIQEIIQIVKDNLDMPEDKLEDKIEEFLSDNWVAITGYGDD